MTTDNTETTEELIDPYWHMNAALEAVAQVARELRRERDEAREALRTLAEHGEGEIQRITKERDEAWEALREIEAADWKTSGELRGMARKALEAAK